MIGIGYRKDFDDAFLPNKNKLKADFIEVAPENWIGVGGYWKKEFEKVLQDFPLFTHGLSLSIGNPKGVNLAFLKEIKHFIETYNVRIYSEHLSYSQCDNAHLYELLPIPFTQDAVNLVCKNIDIVQNFLNRTLVLEIASYYSPVAPEMSESDFINQIVKQSGCKLLLDVNNVYVNAFNHKYDRKAFLNTLPLDKVEYVHMAGHKKVSETLIIDTHGEPIIDPVYDLFDYTMGLLQRDVPVLLERDFNIPEFSELGKEISTIRNIKNKHLVNEKTEKGILKAI